jgi:TrmH family RNA methyltransferase
LITSVSNEKVKFARSLGLKKNRQTNRKFAVESVRAIEEAVRAGIPPALVFFDPSSLQSNARARTLVSQLRASAADVDEVSAKVLAALSETQTPQGIVAVFPYPNLLLPASPDLVLVIDNVRDPGNLGTILRTAWAAGADVALLAPGSADPFNPKVVRASMGAHFAVPIAARPWPEIRSYLDHVDRISLAEAGGETDYRTADWRPPLALIIGSEASGAGGEARELATARVRIPMPGGAESLNAAVATAILLFEAVRARSG